MITPRGYVTDRDVEWIELRWDEDAGVLCDWIEANRYAGRPRVRVELVVDRFVVKSFDYPAPDDIDVACAVEQLKKTYEEKSWPRSRTE